MTYEPWDDDGGREAMAEPALGRDVEPLSARPGYNAKPTEWVRYANYLEGVVKALNDFRQLVAFVDDDGSAVVRPWIDAHKLHRDEPYVGCPFCSERFVVAVDAIEALDAIDKYAAEDMDHDLHAIVEHYRRALNV